MGAEVIQKHKKGVKQMNCDKISVHLTPDEFVLLCEVLKKVKFSAPAKEELKESIKNDFLSALKTKFVVRLYSDKNEKK